MAETWSPVTLTNDTGQKLNATYFNRVETGMEQFDDRIAALEATSALGPSTGKNPLTGVYYANGYSGIDPTGATNSTTGINNLFAAVPSGSTIVFTGTYKINGPLNQPIDETTILGSGYETTWLYTPTVAGTMMTITNAQRIVFENIRFTLPTGSVGAGSTLFKVSNSFAGSFNRCIFGGHHDTAADVYGVTTGHKGVYLTDNTGDWHFYDCHWQNLGVGLQTDCIQNSIVGGRFSLCYVGVYGFGGAGQPGMSITGYVDFVSFGDEPGVVTRNIWCPITSNNWWLSDIWTEGADTSIEFGDGAGAGPAILSMHNCHLAANTTCLKVLGGAGTSLENLYFGYSNSNTSALSVQVDQSNAYYGSAKNLRSVIDSDPARASSFPGDLKPETFPAGWIYTRHGRTNSRLDNIGHTSSYTFVAEDVGIEAIYDSASAGTFTLPTNASQPIPAGMSIPLRQVNTGQLTIAAAGGVTLQSRGSRFKLAGQYAVAEVRKTGTNTWVLSGDITT